MTIRFEDIVCKYPEPVAALVNDLRQFLLSKLKDVLEMPDASANVIGYGYGPGYKDTIVAIILSKKGIKLGFNRGSELQDPAKLLTGTGKVHKYVQIHSAKDLNSQLVTLLEEALKAYHIRCVK